MLIYIYGRRLRSHFLQELLAGSGIAVGVALVFGVLVANASLTGSAGEVVHQVVGSARLQLAARSPNGFDQGLARTVAQLPDVRTSAAISRTNVTILGSRARHPAQLLGVTDGVVRLGGLGTRYFGQGGFRLAGGLLLPASVARAVGAEAGDMVTVLAAGSARRIKVGAVLEGAPFGALASSPVAVTLLPVAQRLAGQGGRLTQILVEPRAGDEAVVRRELRRIAAGHLDVLAADNELRLLDEAAKPTNQSTALFSAISVMVGFLLAMNAMLLTMPERRRFVADTRMQGYDWRQIVVILGFQALLLGVVASLAGIALGALLSRTFFHQVPAYLTSAFPIGTQQIIHVGTVLAAIACGVAATVVASLSSALDLWPGRLPDAVLRDSAGGAEMIRRDTTRKLGLIGGGLVFVITALALIVPVSTILGGVGLALAALLVIPAGFVAVAHGLTTASEHVSSRSLTIAASELRAITTRSVALAGIAALAVYGSVAIGGSRGDLIHGLDRNFAQFLDTADIWVTTGGNDLTTNSFRDDGATAALARVPGIASVRTYQGGFLDVGPRRMWVIARPPTDSSLIPASQLLVGRRAGATQRLRSGGWMTISNGFAEERHLRVGNFFLLPTPSGAARLRVAAITTNLGWAPGAIILTTADYRRYWDSANPSALEIGLKPGVGQPAGKLAVERALAGRHGLGVQTLDERRAQYAADSRQGLQALNEISTLLQIAAALAVALALSAAIWQRRARLASFKIQGYDQGQLWRALLLESSIMLATGCVAGALLGVLGHALASRWLTLRTGFPAPFSIALGQVTATLLLVTGIALAVVALPGLAAARVPARAALED